MGRFRARRSDFYDDLWTQDTGQAASVGLRRLMTRSLVCLSTTVWSLAALCACNRTCLDAERAIAQPLETSPCEVHLSSLGYAAPGSDALDFVVLTVYAPWHDAGTATLGDCGAEALLLLDGQDECAPYRTILLQDVAVPRAGFVGVCSSEAVLPFSCDVTEAEDGPLRSGWLRGGPGDGLRIDGAAHQDYVYAGGASCASAKAVQLPRASAVAGAGDVVVRCGEAYVLAPGDSIGASLAPRCPSEVTTSVHVVPRDAGVPDDTLEGVETSVRAERMAAETAREPSEVERDGGAHDGTIAFVEEPSVSTPAVAELPPEDARGDDDGVSEPLRPPNLGCGTTRAGAVGISGRGGWTWGLVLALWARRRRQLARCSRDVRRRRLPRCRRFAVPRRARWRCDPTAPWPPR